MLWHWALSWVWLRVRSGVGGYTNQSRPMARSGSRLSAVKSQKTPAESREPGVGLVQKHQNPTKTGLDAFLYSQMPLRCKYDATGLSGGQTDALTPFYVRFWVYKQVPRFFPQRKLFWSHERQREFAQRRHEWELFFVCRPKIVLRTA